MAAPAYAFDLEHQFGQEVWSNVFHIDAADLAAAVDVANDIADLVLVATQPTVLQTKGRVYTTALDAYNFVTIPFNRMGTRTGQIGAILMPLYVTARIDFNASVGLPSRKYFRGILSQQDVDVFDTLDSTVLGTLNTLGTALATLPGYVDVDGDLLTGHAVWPKTQMRQLRRRSPKKTPTP